MATNIKMNKINFYTTIQVQDKNNTMLIKVKIVQVQLCRTHQVDQALNPWLNTVSFY